MLTLLDSACKYGPDDPDESEIPMVWLLFKGKKNGRIIGNILEEGPLPPWLKLQVQEAGSYREEDVIDSLRDVLPHAVDSQQSCIVLLDWFSAHRTPAVIDFIHSRGHVVMYHGGGCTPLTQINDTHLHALVQRIMVQLENKVAVAKRRDMHMNNAAGIPTLKRHEICGIVATMWRMLDHMRIARTGYRQTGPLLPMR